MSRLRLLFLFTFLIVSIGGYSQFYSARTNVIGLATGNINAEFGMTLNKKFSIHCPVQYNPFVFSKSNNTKFQNLTVMPCGRYWFRESFRDSFIALSVIGSRYNISNIWDSYRYDGYGAGAGLSFGWTYPMAPRWNFKWEVGVAGLWTSYDKFVHKKAGYKFGHEYGWHIIPHKVAVNLVYLF